MTTRYISKVVDCEVDLSDFDDDDLIEELERRDLNLNTVGVSGDEIRSLLEAVYNNRRLGKSFDAELDQLIYYGLGRIV